MTQGMRFPARACTATDRSLDLSRALSRRAAQDPPAPHRPRHEQGTAVMKASGELVMSFATFQGGDFGQVCQMLGLRPSRPLAQAS